MTLEEMPVMFIGHGSPMNGVEDTTYSRAWGEVAKKIPLPKAVLCISAHWLTSSSTSVCSSKKPSTIHDFFGFPKELYDVRYPANGVPELAEKIQKKVKSAQVTLSTEWGLDHGAWIVLLRMYPTAKIPVLQLSVDYDAPLETHYRIGEELSALRSQGVLILGSGNVVHNLGAVNPTLKKPYEWATEFDSFVKDKIISHDESALINYDSEQSARLAHPTNDHYLPLLYSLGAAHKSKPKFFAEGFDFASVSMRSVLWE